MRTARLLRQQTTAAERYLWQSLRLHLPKHKFRRQHPIGPFIVDFACPGSSLIIELDGEHHASQQQQASDRERTIYLEARGYSVLRFPNHQLLNQPTAVLHTIRTYLKPK